MCRRFAFTKELLKEEDAYPGVRIEEDYEVEPGKKAYGITFSRNGILKAYLFTFGFPSYDGSFLYNARIETAAEKPSFRDDYPSHKAVFPCTSFFEFDRKKKEHEFISEANPILYLAGFYNRERQFVLLTEEGKKGIYPLPPRMPLLLTKEDVIPYLQGKDLTEREHPSLLSKEEETMVPLF